MCRYIAKNIVAAGSCGEMRDPGRLHHRQGGAGIGHGRGRWHGGGVRTPS